MLHLGSPRSISYLFRTVSLTLKAIEFSNINFSVAITEYI